MMKRNRINVSVLALCVGLFLVVGPAWAMGKKPKAVENEKQLGKAGTMKKSYDPETGVKRMEKTIGHGEKTMTLEKGRKEGATVERSWETSPEEKSSPSVKEKSHPKGKW